MRTTFALFSVTLLLSLLPCDGQSSIGIGRGTYSATTVSPIFYVATDVPSASGSTPITTAAGLNVLVGDKLIVFCVTGGANNTLTMTDSAGNTFGKGTHQNDLNTGNTDLFYAVASFANASDKFTCSSSNGAGFAFVIASQYRGGATTSINDVAMNAAGTGVTSWTSTSFSTTAANEVVVQCVAVNSSTPAAGTIGGATAMARGTGGGHACQDVILTSTRTGITGSTNLGSSTNFNGQLGAFK